MSRLLYNTAIINKLQELIKKHPYIRFGQLLVISGIIQYDKGVLLDGQREDVLTIDPFNEESEITWERMKNNKICFNNEHLDNMY